MTLNSEGESKVFGGAPGITHLELGGDLVVTNELISAVCSSLKHLEELKVSNVNNERVTADCLQHLHKLSRIKILRFEDIEGPYLQLQALINACKTLKYLQFTLLEAHPDHDEVLDCMLSDRGGAFVGEYYPLPEMGDRWSRHPETGEPLIPGSAFNVE